MSIGEVDGPASSVGNADERLQQVTIASRIVPRYGSKEYPATEDTSTGLITVRKRQVKLWGGIFCDS